MRFHEPAVTIAAEQISLKRFLSHSVSDEELVELAVTAYREACPNRSRRPPKSAVAVSQVLGPDELRR